MFSNDTTTWTANDTTTWTANSEFMTNVTSDLPPSPTEGDIRLRAGTSLYNGRVEIFHNRRWGTLCDDDLGYNGNTAVARVICRQLGLPFSGAYHIKGGYFGQGSGPIWLDNVECIGSESLLIKCTHNGWNEHNCNHDEDAGVNCTGMPYDSTPTPQMPNSTPNAGVIVGSIIGVVACLLLLFLSHRFNNKLRQLISSCISPSPPEASKKPKILVMSNKDLYTNDIPDDAWGTTITMVHPLFQAFNVHCSIQGGIQEEAPLDGNPYGTSSHMQNDGEEKVGTTTSPIPTGKGARQLEEIFKGLTYKCAKSPLLDKHSNAQNQNGEIACETKLENEYKKKDIVSDEDCSISSHEETTDDEEAAEIDKQFKDLEESSDSSSCFDITSEPVISVSRFHFLN